MKKLLIAGLSLAVLTTACQKSAEKPADTPAQPKAESPATPAPANDKHAEPAKAEPAPAGEHKEGEHHNHNHGDHKELDHAGHHHAGHDHAHPEGDKFSCGDKTVHIVVHEHDGEIEAHITTDNITYDLAEDVQSKGRYTSDDSIAGDNKGMALTLNGDTAKITTLDDKALLDCTKAKS